MSLPDLPRGPGLMLRAKASLPKPQRDARIAALTATLGLFGWKADSAPTSLALIVARTSDLSDEDFRAALDCIADKWDALGNPIPAIRRAAAENAKARTEKDAEAKYSAPLPGAIPCPPDVRRRWLRTASSDATNPTDARAREGAGT